MATALNVIKKNFKVYVSSLNVNILIYPAQKIQINLLIARKSYCFKKVFRL